MSNPEPSEWAMRAARQIHVNSCDYGSIDGVWPAICDTCQTAVSVDAQIIEREAPEPGFYGRATSRLLDKNKELVKALKGLVDMVEEELARAGFYECEPNRPPPLEKAREAIAKHKGG